jgi:transcriptional regulator with XRE-family HTH domain
MTSTSLALVANSMSTEGLVDWPSEGYRERVFRAWYRRQIIHGGELSQEWLAEQISRNLRRPGVLSQGAVSRYLRGHRIPDLDTMAALADALMVDPGWLAFGTRCAAPAPIEVLRDGMTHLEQP